MNRGVTKSQSLKSLEKSKSWQVEPDSYPGGGWMNLESFDCY